MNFDLIFISWKSILIFCPCEQRKKNKEKSGNDLQFKSKLLATRFLKQKELLDSRIQNIMPVFSVPLLLHFL